MAEKKLRKLWSLFGWQYEEIESWLEGMAAQGWHLSHNGLLYAVFVKGEPQEVRYRCDYLKGSTGDSQFKEANWEYVFSCGAAHIFRSPVSEDPVTGPNPRRNLPYLKRMLRGAVAGMAIIAAAFIWNLIRAWPAITGSPQGIGLLGWSIILAHVIGICYTLWLSFLGIRALIRVNRGKDTPKPYRVVRFLNQVAPLGLLTVILLYILS